MSKNIKCYECNSKVIQNEAGGKTFYACTGCKQETNSWGMPIRPPDNKFQESTDKIVLEEPIKVDDVDPSFPFWGYNQTVDHRVHRNTSCVGIKPRDKIAYPNTRITCAYCLNDLPSKDSN